MLQRRDAGLANENLVAAAGSIRVLSFFPSSSGQARAELELVSYSSGPLLGDFEAGSVASLFNVQVSIVSGGILCVAGCALCALLLPAFRAYDARSRDARGMDSGAAR